MDNLACAIGFASLFEATDGTGYPLFMYRHGPESRTGMGRITQFGWIMAGQKTSFSERYFSVDFSRTNHAQVAEAFGVKSWRVSDPAQLKAAFAAAAEHGGPTLVDVLTQPLH